MKFNNILPLLALAGSLCLVQTAVAQTPNLQSVLLECRIVNSQTHTVRAVLDWASASHSFDYGFEFQNAGTAQITRFQMSPMASLHSFPLPQGTYNLTVMYVGTDGWYVAPGHGKATWSNIQVPATVSTHGRGSGCEFASVANRANQIAPAIKPKTN